MTQVAATPMAEAAAASWYERNHFLLRRLHSLTGIVPVGLFVLFHLYTNMMLVFHGLYQEDVNFIHFLPGLLFLEVLGIWLPIAFHAALGLVYTFTGRPNNLYYRGAANWRYTLQRVTGVIALVFIFLHVATLRWGWNIFGWYTPFYVNAISASGQRVVTDAYGEALPLAAATTALAVRVSWWSVAFYAVGSAAVVYHFADGLWTAAITWGATLSVGAMRRWGYACAAVGVVLAIFSGAAIYGSLAYQPTPPELAAIRQLNTSRAAPLQTNDSPGAVKGQP